LRRQEVAPTSPAAVGPLGLRIEPYGPTSFDEARKCLRTRVSALLEGGVDLFVLETFADLSELQQAIKAGSRIV